METRLRMLIVLAGLPEPQVNFTIRHSDGRVRYRLDLSYPELTLAIEYDGRQHADDPLQWRGDTERDGWFDRAHWLKIKVLSTGIYLGMGWLSLVAVLSAVSAGGAEAPRRPRPAWSHPARSVRQTHRHGESAWRASGLPR